MITTASLMAKDNVDGFSQALTSIARDGVDYLLGPAARRVAFGSVTWADVGVVACVVVCVLAAHGIAATLMRHKKANSPAAVAGMPMHHLFLGALAKPLYVLIWLCGIYLVATSLLKSARFGAELDAARGLALTLLDLGLFATAFWGLYRLTGVLEVRLAARASKTASIFDDLIVALLGRSLRVVIPVLGVILAMPILNIAPQYAGFVTKGTSVLVIAALAVILFQAVGISEDAMLSRFDLAASDNLRARKVYTQVRVLGRMTRVAIGIFAASSMLMLFDAVRQIGTSLLASAGIVGIVAGIAAQRTLANLIAGFQIALTQPMRLDDVVVVEGEWGRIEEITLSYVVVHIWDDRRLVVPLAYFIEKPFQNWTRASSELMGAVLIWVDYSFPLEEGRAALKNIIETNPLWDRRFWNLQVTDANERAMQLRVLATSEDSSKSWDLRCQIREKFITFVRESYPKSLPLMRTQVDGIDAAAICARSNA